ncbi:MAG: hypothetical protein JXQ75_14040 [Phycisphaerae bacterium]|nr:hypothetical protein [Phycisphaerae bacterium]
MGRRRVRDLLGAGHEIILWDTNPDRIAVCEACYPATRGARSLDELFELRPEAVVICAPPDTHVGYIQLCYERHCCFFCEVGVLRPPAAWFRHNEERTGVLGVPSATWYYHPLFQMLREQVAGVIAEGATVSTFRYHYASYLPLWHPGEDSSNFYATQLKTGAGREMVHFEGDWILMVLGRPARVAAYHGHVSPLPFRADDAYHIMIEMENGARGLVTIDLHDRLPARGGRIVTSARTLAFEVGSDPWIMCADIKSDKTEIFHPGERRLLCGYDLEQTYRAEILGFADFVQNASVYPKGWADDRMLSSFLVATEMSAAQGRWVSLAEADQAYVGMEGI